MNQNIKPSKIIDILFLCFSETSFSKDVWHQGQYQDLCGVNPDIWQDYLDENNVEHNTLAGGLLIYEFYLEENNGNKEKTLLEYKGVQKNKKVRKIIKKIIRMQESFKVEYSNMIKEVLDK